MTASATVAMSEARARGRKAARIARVLATSDLTADEAASLDPVGRQAATTVAGYTTCSDTTWDTVVGILEAGATS